jgi:hypothetical protein
MNSGRWRLVSVFAALLAAAPFSALTGCTPDLEASVDPLVVTEDGVISYAEPQSPEQAAAVAEMRLNAEAGDIMPYPDAFQSEQTRRLAMRAEPYSVNEASAIEAELAAIARRQRSAITPQEIAVLRARAAELRRVAAEMQAGTSQ